MAKKNQLITKGGCRIRVQRVNSQEYLCLTDLARYTKKPHEGRIVLQWLRLKKTNEFLTQWEQQNNPEFQEVELELKSLSVTKWIKHTGATGMITKRGGRVGGTWAHIDIAVQFMSSLSVEYQLDTIEELNRLMEQERQTDAVQKYLTTQEKARDTTNNPHFVYASEGDLLDKVVFGMSAQEFCAKHPNAGKKENMRESASREQLGLLFVLEAWNAKYISEGKSQSARLKLLEEDKARLLPSLNPQKKLK